jgi:PBS lyase HEAT-like repeat
MNRSSRAIAVLMRSLLLGTAGTTLVLAAASTLSGCKDETQPDYWVEKLSEPSWRARAVSRLGQFYEDASTKANQDNQAPAVQELLNKIVDPLTKTYIENYADLDTKTRVALIKLLADTRDKRAEPAFKKAFEEFAKKPTGNKDDADIKWAVRASGDLKLAGVGDALLQAFQKLKASTQLGGITYRDFNDSMVKMPQKSWTGPLIAMLEAEIVRPESAKDKDKIDPYRDQLFWQTTSAQVLGEIQAPEAVEPLLKVMLDPSKADVQLTGVLALVKIGKPATERTIKLLKGEDEKLISFSNRRVKEVNKLKEDPKDSPHIQTAALILGTIGRGEATAPMLEALKKADKDVMKAVITRELAKLPETPETQAAFKSAFEGISIETNIPPGQNALDMLAETAGTFYDSSMVDWLLERAEKTKGSGEDLKALQATITVTVLKLAKPNQMDKVKGAVDKYGTQIEKDAYKLADGLLKKCASNADCYLKEMESSANQEPKTQFAAIKSGYMVTELGGEKERDQIIDALDSFENAAIRYVAAGAIDHLSPKGSKPAADKIRKVIDKNAESGDQNKIQGDYPLKQVMYRIEARAD